jgi:hypothetical protein
MLIAIKEPPRMTTKPNGTLQVKPAPVQGIAPAAPGTKSAEPDAPPPAPLAIAPEDAPAHLLRSAMSRSIEDATQSVLAEMEGLKQEIDALCSDILQRAALAKDVLSEHMSVMAEAVAFRQRVSERLASLSDAPRGPGCRVTDATGAGVPQITHDRG